MLIDSLEIQIGSQAEQATQSIDKMIRKLDVVSSSIMSVSKNAQGMGTSFRFPNLNNLAKGINSFAKIDTSTIQKTGDRIRGFAKEFQTLANVDFGNGSKQFVSLANSISRLGNKSTLKALDVMPRIAPAINKMMAGLQGAPIVNKNLIDMTNAIGRLAKTGASGGKTINALTSSFYKLPSATNIATKSLRGVQNSFRSLTRHIVPFINLFALLSLGKKSVEIASDLTEIQNVVDVTFGDMTHKVEQFAETSIEQFGMSELTLKKVASTFQAMGSAMNISNKSIANANEYLNKQTDGYVELGNSMADVSLTLTKLTADMASFYNVEQDVVAEDLESIFTGTSRPMRQYGIDLTEATLKEWALKQGMDANIASMTQAEKTMLRYQYVMAHTTQAQGDFARTSDSFSNQLRILKQNFEQLGAIIGGTLINVFKPLIKYINNAMSGIIAFARTISNALGKIFGWEFEVGGGGVTSDLEGGAGYADSISDSMGDAVGNAKKLKTTLLGIDELNVLDNTDDIISGSGGAIGDTIAGVYEGQWKQTQSMVKQFESEIDSLFELGRYISDTLSAMMDSINWESVYEKARGFGTGLAQFFNGLITPELFADIGTTMANSLNTVFEGLNAFAKEFDWSNLGTSIATGIDAFFESWDAGLSAEALSNLASGILDSMTAYISTLGTEDTFKDIGQKLVDFICGIEWKTLAYSLDNFFDALGDALVDFPTDFGLGISEAIWEEISGQDIELTKPKWLENLGEVILSWIIPQIGASRVAEKIANAIFGRHESAEGNKFGGGGTNHDDVTDYRKNIHARPKTQDFAREELEKAFGGAGESMSREYNQIGEDIMLGVIEGAQNTDLETPSKSLFEKFVESICSVFGINSPAENMKPYGEFIFLGILEGFQNMFTSFAESLSVFWTDYVSPWFTTEKWSELYSSIKTELENTWDSVVEWWTTSGIYRWYNDNVKPWFSEENWNFSGIKDGLKKAWDSAVETIKGIWNKFAKWLNEKLTINLDTSTFIGKGISDLIGSSTIQLGKLPTYELGGFPKKASLFWAGENGIPEIAGTVGGKTAVAGGAEITGIRDAVYSTGQTEATLLQTAVDLLQVIASKDMSVNIDERGLVNMYDSRKARNGFAF